MIFKSVFAIASLFAVAVTLIPGLDRSDAMQNIKSGTWGGQGISLSVEDDSATVEYDCGHGTISGPLKVNSDGHFALNGTHVHERGGPVRQGVNNRGVAVTYSGWTDGKRMTLQVTFTESKQAVDYELEYGRTGRLRKCR